MPESNEERALKNIIVILVIQLCAFSAVADNCTVPQGVYFSDLSGHINRKLAVTPQSLSATLYVLYEDEQTKMVWEFVFSPVSGSTEVYQLTSDKNPDAMSCINDRVQVSFQPVPRDLDEGLLAKVKRVFEGHKTLEGKLELVLNEQTGHLQSEQSSCYLKRFDALYQSYIIVNDEKIDKKECFLKPIDVKNTEEADPDHPSDEL